MLRTTGGSQTEVCPAAASRPGSSPAWQAPLCCPRDPGAPWLRGAGARAWPGPWGSRACGQALPRWPGPGSGGVHGCRGAVRMHRAWLRPGHPHTPTASLGRVGPAGAWGLQQPCPGALSRSRPLLGQEAAGTGGRGLTEVLTGCSWPPRQRWGWCGMPMGQLGQSSLCPQGWGKHPFFSPNTGPGCAAVGWGLGAAGDLGACRKGPVPASLALGPWGAAGRLPPALPLGAAPCPVVG